MTDSGRMRSCLTYIGAHYTLCPIEIREFWAKICSSENNRKRLAEYFEQIFEAKTEWVLILTCNRFDLIFLGAALTKTQILSSVCHFAQEKLHHDGTLISKELKTTVLDPSTLAPLMRFSCDHDALKQLLCVVSSLDSLVVGEPHILGQVKTQVQLSLSEKYSGPSMKSLFGFIFYVAKKVRHETELGKNSVSVGHAAVEISKRVVEKTSNANILVIGAGEMGRVICQYLKAQGIKHVTLCNRNLERATQLEKELSTDSFKLKTLLLADGLNSLHQFDIVFVSTAAPNAIVLPSHTLPSKGLKKGSPLVVIDICVPRNVSPKVAQQDHVFLFDIDDLDQIMGANRKARQISAQLAMGIIENELLRYEEKNQEKESLQNLGKFHQWAKQLITKNLETSNQKVVQKNSDSVSAWTPEMIKITSDAIAKAFVSNCANLIRNNVPLPDNLSIGETLSYMFGLEKDEKFRPVEATIYNEESEEQQKLYFNTEDESS